MVIDRRKISAKEFSGLSNLLVLLLSALLDDLSKTKMPDLHWGINALAVAIGALIPH